MIQGEIKRFLRDDGMVKVSRSIKENGWKIKNAAEQLTYQLGRDVTLQELAEATGLTLEEVVMATEANVEVESIYKPIQGNDGSQTYLIDKVTTAAGGGDAETEKLLNHMVLKQLLEHLESAERKLIQLRYFYNRTQTEVAGEMGISQVQVSRLEKKILLRMRSLL